jgi:CII-binding regulator of phage lambda lysogenization HflD
MERRFDVMDRRLEVIEKRIDQLDSRIRTFSTIGLTVILALAAIQVQVLLTM